MLRVFVFNIRVSLCLSHYFVVFRKTRVTRLINLLSKIVHIRHFSCQYSGLVCSYVRFLLCTITYLKVAL